MRRVLILICYSFPLLLNAGQLNAAGETGKPVGWKGEGELGFTSTSGNSDSETLTANLGISKTIEQWKHVATLKTLQAESGNVSSANSRVLTARSEYSISEKSYVFGKLRYENDKFSGFEYQTSLAFGIGSRVIENEQQLLDMYIGLGTRSSKNKVSGETDDDAIVTAGLLYEYQISKTATFNQNLSVEDGDENTRSESETSLKLKIDGNLSAKIAYLAKRNSRVPAGTEKSDKVTTVSLVYGF